MTTAITTAIRAQLLRQAEHEIARRDLHAAPALKEMMASEDELATWRLGTITAAAARKITAWLRYSRQLCYACDEDGDPIPDAPGWSPVVYAE